MTPPPLLLLLLRLLLLLQVTVLTPTGNEVKLSVPTTAGPGGQDFEPQQLAELVRKTLKQP
jgi:hypothetical protein